MGQLTRVMLCALLSALTAVESAGQSRTDVPDLSPVTSRIEVEARRILDETTIPSISISLVRSGRVVWSAAFGYANVGAGLSATEDTYYSTGSTLKPVVAAAIMQLVDDGIVSLETPFNAIVPEEMRIENAGDVTLRHMLAHHAGLEGTFNIVPLWSRERLPSQQELISGTRRIGQPGREYRYCNECYVMAGYVLELLSGGTFDAYLSEEVFAPVGVDAAFPTLPSPAVIERLALPYGSEDGVAVPIEQIRTDVFAAGDAYLRPKDMAAFLAALLNRGTYEGRRILSEGSAEEIMAGQFGSASGLGINVSDLTGRRVVVKNGIFTGYHSFMIGDPVSRHGAYVVANSTDAGPAVAQLARLCLLLLLGEDPPRTSGLGATLN